MSFFYDVMSFLFFDDVQYLQNGKTYRDNSLTVTTYLNKAVFWLSFSIKSKQYFFKISRKVVRLWKRLDDPSSDHFSKLKYLINFVRYRRAKFNIKYAEQESVIT